MESRRETTVAAAEPGVDGRRWPSPTAGMLGRGGDRGSHDGRPEHGTGEMGVFAPQSYADDAGGLVGADGGDKGTGDMGGVGGDGRTGGRRGDGIEGGTLGGGRVGGGGESGESGGQEGSGGDAGGNTGMVRIGSHA